MIESKKFDSSIFIADGAKIIGNVTMGKECSVWYNAVIRADNNTIIIGEGTNIQDNAVLHLDEGDIINIGNHVTIGHGAIVHGCTIADNCIIGMGSIIMNGAKIGKNCIIGAGAIVTERKEIPDNSVVIGAPGKVTKQLKDDEIAKTKQSALHYFELAKRYMQ